VAQHLLDSGDSPELQALFDSVAQQAHPGESAPQMQTGTQPVTGLDPMVMYNQVGNLTRKLHETLKMLGYDQSLERIAASIPDAKDRLNYIASMTEQAAERVLNAAEIARPLQDDIEGGAQGLTKRWEQVFGNQLPIRDFPPLATATRAYLQSVPGLTHETSSQLLEIVMAQDFQDLTGQVIKKLMVIVKEIEQELVSLLIAGSPNPAPPPATTAIVEQEKAIADQKQVDDLLASLGF